MARTRSTRPRRRPIERAADARQRASSRWWWAVPAFLAATLLLKLTIMRQLESHPLLQPDAGLDTQAYVQLARRVLSGDLWLGPGLYYLSPLYLYFLAAAWLAGDSFSGVRALQVTLGTAGVYAIFVMTREWFGLRAAWVAAVLAASTGVFTFYEILLLQSALDPCLTAAALCCLTLALTRGSRRWAFAAGAAFGLQTLNRPNLLFAAAVAAVVMALIRRGRIAVAVALGILVALVPVVVRNAVVSREFALVSSHGGLNFYIGNHERATGQYAPIPGVRADIEGQSEDTRRIAETATGRSMTDSEVSSYYWGLALAWMRANPAAAAALFLKKIALTFSAAHQWLDFSYPYYAHDTGSLLGALAVGPWLLIPIGIAGLAAGVRRSRDFIAWASFVPAYGVAVAIFFVAERYRLPLFVPLCVGAGAAVDLGLDAVAKRQWRPAAVPAAALALACAVAFWPHHLDDGRFEERLRLSKVLMNRQDFAGAADELRKAHQIRPDQTVAEFNLGIALTSDGRAAEGIPYLRHAVASGVPVPGARYALANAVLRSGDRVGAAALLRTFQPEPSDSAESCVQVAYVAVDAGAPDAAERFLRQAAALKPGWDVPQMLLARLHAGQSFMGRQP
jgi:4-amino-4-deoxy-L-arabinose transferase-like glycosyltransferase